MGVAATTQHDTYQTPVKVDLDDLKNTAPDGTCPMCGDPLAEYKGVGRHPNTCGSEECKTAYHRYYKRAIRNKLNWALERIRALEIENAAVVQRAARVEAALTRVQKLLVGIPEDISGCLSEIEESLK